MAQNDNPCQPRSMTLMAGPIDCRVNPTTVNELATANPIEWFEQNLITTVPSAIAGARGGSIRASCSFPHSCR